MAVWPEMEAKSALGATPLLEVAAKGHKEVANTLLKNGAGVSANMHIISHMCVF